jgi:mRNA interferase MazF
MDKPIKRGEIYYTDLNPTVGCEQGDNRPVLVIQNDVYIAQRLL